MSYSAEQLSKDLTSQKAKENTQVKGNIIPKKQTTMQKNATEKAPQKQDTMKEEIKAEQEKEREKERAKEEERWKRDEYLRDRALQRRWEDGRSHHISSDFMDTPLWQQPPFPWEEAQLKKEAEKQEKERAKERERERQEQLDREEYIKDRALQRRWEDGRSNHIPSDFIDTPLWQQPLSPWEENQKAKMKPKR